MILDTLKTDYKQAMRDRDAVKKQALNYIIAQIKNKQIDSSEELTDNEIHTLIRKEIKARLETISFLEKAENNDEVANEQAVIDILDSYLPSLMNEEETKKAIQQVMADNPDIS